MPRKTLALISGLVLVTVVLFIIALRTNSPKPTTQVVPSMAPAEPTSVAHSVLTIAPNPVTLKSGQQGSVDVMIDTSDNEVTAVQLELAYDPNVLSNVKVTPGPLFQQPAVLIDKNDKQAGRYTFAFGIQPNQPTIKGTGAVAKITFTAKGALGTQSQLALLGQDPTIPEKVGTIVTARGVAETVLKDKSGTLIIIGNTASSSTAPSAAGQTTQPPVSR